MSQLLTNSNLQDYQQYVQKLEEERGFTNNTVLQNSLMLGEEVGELFNAIRKAQNMKIDPTSQVGNIEEEVADIFIYLCSIANNSNLEIQHKRDTAR